MQAIGKIVTVSALYTQRKVCVCQWRLLHDFQGEVDNGAQTALQILTSKNNIKEERSVVRFETTHTPRTRKFQL